MSDRQRELILRIYRFECEKEDIARAWEDCKGKRGAPIMRKSLHDEWLETLKSEFFAVAELYESTQEGS